MVRSQNGRSERYVPVGLVVELIEKKCWRTAIQGKQVDWNAVDPEPHAVVLYKDSTLAIPVVDLEVVKS